MSLRGIPPIRGRHPVRVAEGRRVARGASALYRAWGFKSPLGASRHPPPAHGRERVFCRTYGLQGLRSCGTPCTAEPSGGSSRTAWLSRRRWSIWRNLVGRVQRRDLVALGQRRVVEDRVDEVVDGAAAAHHRLADVDQLGRAGADARGRRAVGAVLRGDQQLEHAVRVADDLAAGEFAVAGDADLERDRSVGQLVLGLADDADLRDRVDADREEVVHRVDRLAERVAARASRPCSIDVAASAGKPITSPTA